MNELEEDIMKGTAVSNQNIKDDIDYSVKKEDVHKDKGKYDITEETSMD